MSAQLKDRTFGDTGEVQTCQEIWLVTLANSGDKPLSDSQLPALHSTHPMDTRMRVDRLTARITDMGIGLSWLVTVDYSSDGRFSWPPQNDNNDLLYKAIQDTFARTVISVPYLVKQYIDPPLAPGVTGPPQPVVDWLQATLNVDSYLENVQIVLNRDAYTYQDRQTIQSQQNKYHYLSPTDTSRLFRFNGAEVIPRGKLWQYTYSWVGEGGLIGTIAPDTSNGVVVADGGSVGSETILVPPVRYAFGNFVVVPSTGNTRPTIKVVYPYVLAQAGSVGGDITGYAQGAALLPGNPV